MDFRLPDGAREWREIARRFADEAIRPMAATLDAQPRPEDGWSWEIVEKADACGIRQAPAPVRHGGHGTDHLTNITILEELAAADAGAAAVFGQHWRSIEIIQQLGTPEQCDELLGRLAANPRGLLAMSITEPEAGSDNVLPYNAPGAGVATSARPVYGGYRINGRKCLVFNANRADVLLCIARTDPSGPLVTSATCFAVPAETPGVSFGVVHDMLGQRLANNGEIGYDDVFVPQENIIGPINGLYAQLTRPVQASNCYTAACALGVMRECFDRTLTRARTRVQGGRPIIEHQSVGAYLADMYTDIELTRTYLWRAAWNADHDPMPDLQFTVLPKLVAAERSISAARRALELWGGAGLVRGGGIEKLWRDCAGWLSAAGTPIVLRQRMADILRAQ